MSTNEPNTDDVERYKEHVKHVTEMIADDLADLEPVESVDPSAGVIWVVLKPGCKLGLTVLEPIEAHGCNLSRVHPNPSDGHGPYLRARVVVPDDRLRSGWSQ